VRGTNQLGHSGPWKMLSKIGVGGGDIRHNLASIDETLSSWACLDEISRCRYGSGDN
jgi:hypothetical protein